MFDILSATLWEAWIVLGEMGVYLVFGFLMAGVLSVCISPALVERHLGRRGLWPVMKASLFGVPLPLCSCSVIPVSASIRRHGAGRGATTAFLLSTPQTGVDSIAITYALLGPVFAVFRPIAAFATGLFGGYLVQLVDDRDDVDSRHSAPDNTCSEPCCAETGSGNIVMRALRYGLVTLPRDLAPSLLLGVLIAGAMAALVPEGRLAPYLGGGVVSILLLMAAGTPLYVCATASVPIALGFMHAGASPGAALAFLIAGPATNAATFTTLWKLLGRRTAMLYLFTVAASAIACGLALDWLIPAVGTTMPQLGAHVHEGSAWLIHGGATGLLALFAFSYWFAAPKGASVDPANTEEAAGPQRVELAVSGMTCGHCADTVRQTLLACDGVNSAEVDLTSARVVVAGEHFDPNRLVAAVAELGYAVETVDSLSGRLKK
ncbi:MAG: SO_0444 family Cu/Zn efflux transporter [Thermoguttaceae bacterium]